MLVSRTEQTGFRRSAVAFALAGIMSAPALADTDKIEVIEVWSTAVKTSALYLKEQEIADKQADHVSDLLRSIPGVDVGGAHSLNQRITIRSMDDKDLKISIDGAAQNTYMYHHMGNLQIHADILKSVDIETGTNSVINGGLGGAVRFETKEARELLQGDDRYAVRVSAGAATNAGRNYSLTGFGLLTDDIDFLAYYNHVERDNYEVGGGKILDQNDKVIEGTNGEVKGLEGDVSDALIKFGWNIDQNQRLALSYEAYEDEGNYAYRPDMGLATDMVFTNGLGTPLLWDTQFTRDTVTLSYDLELGMTSVKASLFSNTSELYRDEKGWLQAPTRYHGSAGLVTGEAKNSGFNVLAETNMDALFADESHTFTYGVDYIKHDTDYVLKTVDANAVLDGGALQSEETAKNLALFVQDRIEFANGFVVIPGVRHDSYDIDSKVVDNDFSEFSLSLALEYQVTDNFLVKLSSTELFKGPEIGEVFVGAGLKDVENPNIKAETGVNTELSLAFQREFGNETDIRLGATLFDTNIENYIYDGATRPNATKWWDTWKTNVGDMQLTGYEVYAGYNVGAFSAQFTYAKAESDLEANKQYIDLDKYQLERTQGDSITAELGYYFEQYNVNVSWEMQVVDDVPAGKFLGGATKDNSKDGYTVHDVSASWQPNSIENLSLRLSVENLFDEFYASQSSKTGVTDHPLAGEAGLFLMDYEPGRNIKASVSYQF